jgi:hypothetical protein
MEAYSDELSDGKYSLYTVTTVCDDGIQVYVGGGEKTHIGSVAISQPRKSLTGDGSFSCTTSVFNLLGHKDDAVSVTLAEAIATALNCVVVVTAGVHVNAASSADIERLLQNTRRLTEKILTRLKKLRPQTD